MRNTLRNLLTAGLLAVTGGLLHGQVTVLQYTFASDLNPTTEASNVSGAAVGGVNTGDRVVQRSTGNGIAPGGSVLPIDDGTPNGPTGRVYGRMWNTDGSGDFQHYFSFGFSVDSGSLTLGSGSSLELDMGARSEGPTTYAISYSTDGFSSETFIAGSNLVAANGPSTLVGGDKPTSGKFDFKRVNHLINVGVVSSGTDMDFRVYLGESDGVNNGDGNFYLDNITVTAVPEPSSYALVFGGVALAGLLLRRRRK